MCFLPQHTGQAALLKATGIGAMLPPESQGFEQTLAAAEMSPVLQQPVSTSRSVNVDSEN